MRRRHSVESAAPSSGSVTPARPARRISSRLRRRSSPSRGWDVSRHRTSGPHLPAVQLRLPAGRPARGVSDRCRSAVSGKDVDEEVGRVVRVRNHVHRDELADASGRHRARVSRGLDRGDVAANENRHEAALGVLALLDLDLRGLDHRVGGLRRADETPGLDHSQRAPRHAQYLTGSRATARTAFSNASHAARQSASEPVTRAPAMFVGVGGSIHSTRSTAAAFSAWSTAQVASSGAAFR